MLTILQLEAAIEPLKSMLRLEPRDAWKKEWNGGIPPSQKTLMFQWRSSNIDSTNGKSVHAFLGSQYLPDLVEIILELPGSDAYNLAIVAVANMDQFAVRERFLARPSSVEIYHRFAFYFASLSLEIPYTQLAFAIRLLSAIGSTVEASQIPPKPIILSPPVLASVLAKLEALKRGAPPPFATVVAALVRKEQARLTTPERLFIPEPLLWENCGGAWGSGCMKKEGLKACSKCLSVRYCSPQHQREDWTKHKEYCFKPVW